MAADCGWATWSAAMSAILIWTGVLPKDRVGRHRGTARLVKGLITAWTGSFDVWHSMAFNGIQKVFARF